MDTLYDVKRTTNRRLGVLGVLPTLCDGRSAHSRPVFERIGADYGVTVLGWEGLPRRGGDPGRSTPAGLTEPRVLS